MRAERSGEAGLSLIELLVALALLGLLFGLLQGGLHLGQRVWERTGSRLVQQIEPVEAAQALLRERLLMADPVWDPVGRGSVAFEGDRNSLSFESRLPDAFGPGAQARMLLSATVDGVLELAWVPATDRSPLPAWSRSPLLAGVAGLEIAYYGTRREEARDRWHESWEQERRPPRQVRLRVAFRPGEELPWPDLVVDLRAMADLGCKATNDPIPCQGRP